MEKEFKKINFKDGILKTDTHTYRIASTLSVDKYQEFLLLQNQVGFGITFELLFNKLKEIYDAANKMDFVRIAAITYNTMDGIKSGVEMRVDPVLRLCALFLIREDEDQTVYNEELNKEKIADWTQSGIDFQDFFALAVRVVPGLLNALNEISEITLTAEKKLQQLKKTSASTKLESKDSGNG